MKRKGKYTDKDGYLRNEQGKLIHRAVAYHEIYLKERQNYSLPFSKLVVHHVDENKKNNKVSNLVIVTSETHNKIHGYPQENRLDQSSSDRKLSSFTKNKRYKKKPIKNKIKVNTIQPGKRPTSYKRRSEKVSITISNKVLFFVFIFFLIFVTTMSSFELFTGGNLETVKEPTVIAPEPMVVVPEPEPIVVEGSGSTQLSTKKYVVITNNLEENISLNVTYRIYSKWFGKDTTTSKVFDVEAGVKESFLVYENYGCRSHSCTVTIQNYEQLN